MRASGPVGRGGGDGRLRAERPRTSLAHREGSSRIWASPPGSWSTGASCALPVAPRGAHPATGSEFHEHLPEEKLQAAGRPLHGLRRPLLPHGDDASAGWPPGCPINNLIPEWNDLVYRGLWREALDRLHKTNNFPEFTGRVCPAPCEGSCVLGINEPPVTIKSIECAIIDKGFEEGWIVARAARQAHRQEGGRRRLRARPGWPAPPSSTGRAPRHRLRARRPHRRPAHVRHPQHEARQDGRRSGASICMAEEGVELRHQHRGRQGRTRPTSCARSSTPSCCAAAPPSRATFPIEGRKLKGIHFAMEFLHANTQEPARQQPRATAVTSPRKDKDVIVIGGGDTGTDCVGTSLRHGCRSLVQFEILPTPPARARRRQPLAAVAEGLQARLRPGGGRRASRRRPAPATCIVTKRFVGDDDGHVKELQTVAGGVGRRTATAGWRHEGDARARRRSGRPTWCCWRWASSAPRRPGCSASSASSVDARGNVAADDEQGDQRPGRLRRGRHAPRPVARRLGHPRGAGGRPRRRPLPDGRHAAALDSGP